MVDSESTNFKREWILHIQIFAHRHMFKPNIYNEKNQPKKHRPIFQASVSISRIPRVQHARIEWNLHYYTTRHRRVYEAKQYKQENESKKLWSVVQMSAII